MARPTGAAPAISPVTGECLCCSTSDAKWEGNSRGRRRHAGSVGLSPLIQRKDRVFKGVPVLVKVAHLLPNEIAVILGLNAGAPYWSCTSLDRVAAGCLS